MGPARIWRSVAASTKRGAAQWIINKQTISITKGWLRRPNKYVERIRV